MLQKQIDIRCWYLQGSKIHQRAKPAGNCLFERVEEEETCRRWRWGRSTGARRAPRGTPPLLHWTLPREIPQLLKTENGK